MKTIKYASIIAALLAPGLGQAQIPQCKDLACISDAVEKIAKASFEKKEYVGMSVVVVDRDKGSFDRHFGYRDLNQKLPTTKDTIYEIGSITKPFSFLTLAVQDKVKLKDPISKYLPEGIRNPQPGGEDIQFKHLVTHTSGLPRQPCVRRKGKPKRHCYGETDDWEDPYKKMTEKAFYEFVDNVALEFEDFKDTRKPPGKFFRYSSAGAALAGELVARAHGTSFEEFVHGRLLDPLKMSASFLSLPCSKERDCSQLAKVYRKRKASEPWVLTKWRTAPFAKGTGRLKSTSVDMEKFLRANLNPDSSPLKKTLKRGHQRIDDVTASHNSNICKKGQDSEKDQCNPEPSDLHWAWAKDRNDPVLWHDGATTGSQAMMEFTQDGNFGVVVMQNSRLRNFDYASYLSSCIMYVAGKRTNPAWCEKFEDAFK